MMVPSWAQSGLSQAQSSATVLLMAFTQGMLIGWTSPVLEKFAARETPFALTEDQQSWVVALNDVGIMLGAWASAAVFTRAGRRLTITVSPTALTLWSLLTYFATSPAMLMAARLLGGASQGIVLSFSYIYIGEVASARARGLLVLVATLLLPGGELVAYTYGPYVSYGVQALAPLPCIALIYLTVFLWMQETPFYLAMAGRHDEMLRSLRRLRRGVPDAEVEREAVAIRAAVERQQSEAAGGGWRDALRPPAIRYGAFLVLVNSSALALVGISTVLSYTTQIFVASGAPIDKNVASMMVMAVHVVMVVVAMPAIEKFGRRPVLSLASFGNALAMGGMCAFMILKQGGGADTSAYSWVPLALMVFYIACTGVGVNAVPQVLMSELLGQRVKAILAPVVMTIVALTSFLCTKYFLTVGEDIGYAVPFGFFAGYNLFIGVFTLLLVPETKGKTLAEVQEMLRRGRSRGKEQLSSDPEKFSTTQNVCDVSKGVEGK